MTEKFDKIEKRPATKKRSRPDVLLFGKGLQ